MIYLIKNKNIFDSKCNVLVCTVNLVGVMGAGIALAVKNKYPEVYKMYKNHCNKNVLQIGHPLLYPTKDPNKRILCFPTKDHWKNNSKLEYIESGLKHFVAWYDFLGIKSVAFPPLGCGLGKLNWKDEVKPIMLHYLNDLDIEIEIYET